VHHERVGYDMRARMGMMLVIAEDVSAMSLTPSESSLLFQPTSRLRTNADCQPMQIDCHWILVRLDTQWHILPPARLRTGNDPSHASSLMHGSSVVSVLMRVTAGPGGGAEAFELWVRSPRNRLRRLEYVRDYRCRSHPRVQAICVHIRTIRIWGGQDGIKEVRVYGLK
jgi:hypothetical protein